MTDPSPELPPFAALRAFHAAARHGRFRDAARDLGVTESAISHQIRRLEDFLHVQLFERNGPKVSLTAAGVRYFDGIDPALAQIGQATRDLAGPADRGRVALTLPPSVAIYWLIPKLAAFEKSLPDIDLQLVTTTRLLDLRREQVDLAIRYGRGPWPDVDAQFLMAETATPVCVPGLLAPDAISDTDKALGTARLIINEYFPNEWPEWAIAHGIALPSLDGALRFESQEQALAAAEQGLGVAIGRSPLVDESLKTGVLIAPFGMPDPSGAGFHLCRARGDTPTASARRVARWLLEFAERREAPPGSTDS